MSIYTPFTCITSMQSKENPSTCTKIELNGFEISICMDTSVCGNKTNLTRTLIRVYGISDGLDHTKLFLVDGEDALYGEAEILLRVMTWITTGQVAAQLPESMTYKVQANADQVVNHVIFGALDWKVPNHDRPNQVVVYYMEKSAAQEIYRTLRAAGKTAFRNWLD